VTDSAGTDDPQGLDATSEARPRRARGAAKSRTGSNATGSTSSAEAASAKATSAKATDDGADAEVDDPTDDADIEDSALTDQDVADSDLDDGKDRDRDRDADLTDSEQDAADAEEAATTSRRKRSRSSKVTASGKDPSSDKAAETGVAARSKTTAKRDGQVERVNVVARIWRYYREVVAELRKVIWPTRRELVTYTTVVVIFVAIIVALVAGLDYVFARGVLKVFG